MSSQTARTIVYRRIPAAIDRAASTDDTIRFIGATEGEKPDGIDLLMDGAELGRYQANPIFGWGHRYHGRENLPIGRSERTEVDDQKRLMFDITFDRKDSFAKEVERKYRERFLNAVSIGFSVIEWEDPKTQDYYRGGTATRWELYELSGVPLPMDANAVVDSGRSGLAVEQELLDAVRGLLNRLDASSIADLRALLDNAGVPREQVERAGEQPTPEDAPVAGTRLAIARRRLQLMGA